MATTVPGLATGLCSVTLRAHSVPEVAAVAAAAGLSCVEWGADVHVPPGDLAAARLARETGVSLGLRAASYGSYFRAGPHGSAEFAPVLASAVALGVPRIRVWAGVTGSAEASPDEIRATASATRAAAERAADAGIGLAFEYHGNTLTDTAESALRLLAEVDHPGVRTYWQPRVGMPDQDAVRDLERVLSWVDTVHAFSWWPGEQRLPLAARDGLWRGVLSVLHASGRPHDVLLEFVPGDDPGQVREDAAALLRLAGDRG
jgi:sugar phosphate isomerase/epimerase